jgi:N-methylhydantoinase B/oxoprolinase/acetone carboxylase alpha subunit
MIARGRTRFLKTKEVGVSVLPGTVFLVESAGGGGYGDPRRRDPAARKRDRENGLVTGKNGRTSTGRNSKDAKPPKNAKPPYKGRRKRRPYIKSRATNIKSAVSSARLKSAASSAPRGRP